MIQTWKFFFNRYSKAHERLMHALVLLPTLIVFFLFDFFAKYFLFDFDPNKQNIGVSYIIFGIRSFPHANTTIISFLNWKINPDFLAIFSMFLAILIIIWALNVKRKLLVFWLMLICAGIFGNSLDFLRYGYVRDIIYLPWFDRGTFNIADILISGGAIGWVLSIVFIELKTKLIDKAII